MASVFIDLPLDQTGSGTVTSVALSAPAEFTVSGSPVTTSGTLTFTKANQSANLVYAGPTSGGAVAPTFRSLVTADMPAGTGTVTSVALTSPGVVYTVSGSPITTSGTFALSLVNQSANTIFAGPTSGGATAPTFRSIVTADLPANGKIRSFGISVDGAGSAVTTGVKGYFMVPYACTITGWTLLGDVSGSMVMDVWKDTYANYPPTVADTITGADKPTISASTKGQNLTLTLWTTAVSAGDTFGYNVDSCSTITKATLVIQATVT